MSFSQYDRVKLRHTSSSDGKPPTAFFETVKPNYNSVDGPYDGFIGTVLEGPLSEPPHKDVPVYKVQLDSGQVDTTDMQYIVKATEGALILVEPASADDLEFLEAREKYRGTLNE
jgi:hypothetical protein